MITIFDTTDKIHNYICQRHADVLSHPVTIWYIHPPHHALQWRHNEHHGVSTHQPYDCLLKRLFRCTSKKISKLSVTGLCEENSPVTGEFPAQRASNAENVSTWWRHHGSHKNRCHGHEWRTRVPFVQCQPVIPFLRKGCFKLWPFNLKVNVMGVVKGQGHTIGPVSY